MKWDLVVAANDDPVLSTCLLASEGIGSAGQVIVQRGFASASQAYNDGLAKAGADIVVFAHQDVYLPEGWDQCLARAIDLLETSDPDWSVAGVFGIATDGKPKGNVYCAGLQRVIGKPLAEPVETHSLDEIVLILRREARLRFDDSLPGFHFYGTDICERARAAGSRCYVLPLFCVHNTAGFTFLPRGFWRSYFYMRRRWWDRLPIKTPCIVISKWGVPFLQHPLQSAYARYVKGERPGRRAESAASLYRRLVQDGRVACPGPVQSKAT
jgi:hypothetical protein